MELNNTVLLILTTVYCLYQSKYWINWAINCKSDTCDEGGTYFRISFWQLLMNFKKNYLFKKKCSSGPIKNKKKNFNLDSLHARLNSHYAAWSYKKRSTKKITGYRKFV